MRVVDRLSTALVMEVDSGELSLDTAVEILQETTEGALTDARGLLEGCLSDLLDYRLDGTVPDAEPIHIETTEDPCPQTTAEVLSDLAWCLVEDVEGGKLSLDTAVFLYSIASDKPRERAEEFIAYITSEHLASL